MLLLLLLCLPPDNDVQQELQQRKLLINILRMKKKTKGNPKWTPTSDRSLTPFCTFRLDIDQFRFLLPLLHPSFLSFACMSDKCYGRVVPFFLELLTYMRSSSLYLTQKLIFEKIRKKPDEHPRGPGIQNNFYRTRRTFRRFC